MEKLYKIVKPGSADDVVHGLSGVTRHHAQMMMIEHESTPINGLEVGAVSHCRFRSSGTTGDYDVVRVQ